MPISIPKAIEILSDSANRGMTTFNQDHKDAENLGIEALKCVRETRRYVHLDCLNPLPGETVKATNGR